MAFIHKENITISVQQLLRNGSIPSSCFTDDLLSNLEQIAQELVGSQYIVEVARSEDD